MSGIKPSIRMRIRDLNSQYLKVSEWLNSFSKAFSHYAEMTDTLYEIHKDEINKLLEEQSDAEKVEEISEKTVQEEGVKGEESG